MIEAPPRRSSSVWPIWAWIMVTLAVLATAIALVGDVFARSLILDLVSFWPGLILVMLVAAALYPFHRGEWTRLAAVVPLLILTWLASTIALHLTEWSALPSAAADFEGPASAGMDQASMTAVLDGELSIVFADTSFLYELSLIRKGGSVPAARSFERTDDSSAEISINERNLNDTWFKTKGWRLRLSTSVAWDLNLDAPELAADLRGAPVSSLRLAGAGSVSLPEPSGSVEMVVDGDFEVIVPVGVSMVISGVDVSVPADWTTGEGEWSAPGTGDPYVVTVTSGASLVVKEA